jgi:predicted 3-demethylubiquinone-9 3-methyltransferase (glyoxalase superfamily)
MSKISPCLWFKDEAEEAANFYVSLLPDSHIDHVQRVLADGMGGKEGEVLIVEFTLAGQSYQALNGNSNCEFTHAISLSVDCKDQAEVDRLWDRLADGGEPVACGWIKDRYGVSWQIVPSPMLKFLADPNREKAVRAMRAMMDMVKLDIAAIQAAYEGEAGN